ncbi:MAG TPA: O-antigen ligase family protein [Blastocatellia bacterium]|nr:O-antigen ligase family protein [Blastocatellia bacterium]
MKMGQHSDKTFFDASSRPRAAASLIAVAAVIAITLVSVLCAAGKYREAAAAGFVTLAVGYILSANVSIESILIFWFATTPLASFYVRFPLDKSIITYNRAVIFLAVAVLVLKSYKAARIDRLISDFSLTKFEIAWTMLSLASLASALIRSNDAGYAMKLAVDTFFLPVVAFHLARHHFDARSRKSALLIGAIALALFLFATGAYEFATGTNLFQYKGSALVREGERRVNGPFASDSSYAIISLLLALFLQALPGIMGARLSKMTRLAYSCAIAAVVLASLLPLFRATAIALIVCLIILKIAARKSVMPVSASALSSWLVVIMITLIFAGVSLGYFSSGRRLTDPRNAFGRLATWEAAAGIAIENPLFGVGLANYQDYFRGKYNWEDESVEQVMDTRAANSPHSNLFWVAAELGALAFALYVAANLQLFLMGWRALKRAAAPAERTAAACYLALFAAYWIHGLTLASGYYSDLNLYFFFMLGLLSNKSMVSDS